MKSNCDKKDMGFLLQQIDKVSNFKDRKACRFTMFVRLRPGYVSHFKNQVRTWCFRGDKYTAEEPKMLKNLINLVKNKLTFYDRIIIYDHDKALEDREILKIVDDEIQINLLDRYQHTVLKDYAIPKFLK